MLVLSDILLNETRTCDTFCKVLLSICNVNFSNWTILPLRSICNFQITPGDHEIKSSKWKRSNYSFQNVLQYIPLSWLVNFSIISFFESFHEKLLFHFSIFLIRRHKNPYAIFESHSSRIRWSFFRLSGEPFEIHPQPATRVSAEDLHNDNCSAIIFLILISEFVSIVHQTMHWQLARTKN